jgi:hypothetical protein
MDLDDEVDGIAATLDEGATLKLLHEHQRLRLDEELDAFMAQVKARQALELRNIAPVLRTIANDSSVLHSAQRKAKALLVLADANGPD